MMPTHDVIVVGARVAGAATAMLLARQGLRVLVVDRDRYGTDTLSTHALMRSSVFLLSRWGVLDRVIEAEKTSRGRVLPFFCHEATIRGRLFSLLYNPFSLEVPG